MNGISCQLWYAAPYSLLYFLSRMYLYVMSCVMSIHTHASVWSWIILLRTSQVWWVVVSKEDPHPSHPLPYTVYPKPNLTQHITHPTLPHQKDLLRILNSRDPQPLTSYTHNIHPIHLTYAWICYAKFVFLLSLAFLYLCYAIYVLLRPSTFHVNRLGLSIFNLTVTTNNLNDDMMNEE